MARDRGQVADELVAFLAHQTAAVEVRDDSLQQIRRFQQFERFSALLVAELHFLLRRFERFADLVGLQTFERQENLADVLADDVFLEAQFFGGALDEGGALAVGLQVECIGVKVLLPRHQHVGGLRAES